MIKKTLLIMPLLVLLTGCGVKHAATNQTAQHKRDWTEVYDASGHKVVTLTKQQTANYLSDHLGDDEGNATHHRLPRSSQLQFKYVGHQKRGNYQVTTYIYSNHYAKSRPVSNLPTTVWKLSSQEYAKMSHPSGFE